MRVVLINPPRYYWPFINEGDNYLLGQALPCLAAALRANDIEVKPIDCMPLKMGWKSLRAAIERERPDVVGVTTSETMFSPVGLQTCALVKDVDPKITTVVGGHHFSALAEQTLATAPVDFVVIGEGDITFPELIKEMKKPQPDFKRVEGIAFKKNGKAVFTPPRPLVENLDDLPMPAYDLMPMKKYSNSQLLWSPGGTTIYHSRGCVGSCNFCACWVHMAQRRLRGGKTELLPKWRTKSPERTIEEIELLRRRYNKRFLVFADDTWNVDPKWSAAFADTVKERGLDFRWYAFMRTDFLVRDEKLGILKKLVDVGLSHVAIGAERGSDDELRLLGKNYRSETTREAFRILREKYPEIFRQATFIIGFKNESKETLEQLLTFARELDPDYAGFHPLTPVPGTLQWKRAVEEGLLEVKDFGRYDWMTPIMPSAHLSREQIEHAAADLHWRFLTTKRILRGLLSRGTHKRNLYLWCLLIAARMATRTLGKSNVMGMVKPSWYDT